MRLHEGEDGEQETHQPEIRIQPPEAGGDPAGGDDRIRPIHTTTVYCGRRVACRCSFSLHAVAGPFRPFAIVPLRSNPCYHAPYKETKDAWDWRLGIGSSP